jgi:hypothetical protein
VYPIMCTIGSLAYDPFQKKEICMRKFASFKGKTCYNLPLFTIVPVGKIIEFLYSNLVAVL